MFKGIMFFLREGWKYDRRYVLWLFLQQLTGAMLPVGAALLPKYVIDELAGQARIGRLALIVGGFCGYTLLAGALNTFFARDGFTRRCRVDAEFGFRLHARLARADYACVESPDFLDMQAKAKKFLTCDYHGFGYLLDCAAAIVGRAATLAGLIAILSTLSLWYVLLFAVLATAASIIENRAARAAMALSMEVVSASRRWTYCAGLFESPEFAKEIRLNGIGSWLLRKEQAAAAQANGCIKRQNDCYIASGVKRSALTFVQQCAAYALLIARVLSGGMGVGSFTMCVSAVASFGDALRGILDSALEIRAYDLYYAQLDRYLNAPDTLRQGRALSVPGEFRQIELRDVGFRYPGSDRWALRHVSFTIRAGERLSLVGENGSGKTTLIKLLCRLYEATEGAILLDGTDIRDLDYDSWLGMFSAVFQDCRFMDATLRENLTFNRAGAEAGLARVLKRLGLDGLVNALPGGADTALGRRFDERGFEPSGGETQRLALARALLRNAPILLLDEPTAALDPRAEHAMLRDFDELAQGRTAVYISHRLSSVRFCDRIAVLAGGQLVEMGSHEELMAKRGVYAELYSLQAGAYAE